MNPVRADLEALRDAVTDGADWLDTMLSFYGATKRFAKMHAALTAAIPRTSNAILLSEYFGSAKPEQVAAFIDDAISRLTEVELALPTWPTLSMPNGVPI